MHVRKVFRRERLRTCCLAMVLLFIARGAIATATDPAQRSTLGAAKSPIVDVALAANGTLTGQLTDADGKPLVGAPVVARQEGREVAQAQTDRQGEFTMTRLRGGLYEIGSPQAGGVFRLWPAGAEPIAARSGILLIANTPIVRGQMPPGGWGWVRSPWVVFTGAAAGIATPMVMANDDPSAD